MGNFKEILNQLNAPTQKVKCSKCGKIIEIPNPPNKTLKNWGCYTYTIFQVAYLISNNWHIRNRGVTDNHPFFCPDCWDGTEPEFTRHPLVGIWVEKSKEWLKNNLKEEQK